MSRATATVLIVLAIIVGLGIYKVSYHKNTAPTIDTTDPSLYFCKEGLLKVTYSNNTAVLRLLDGRTISLPQTISGSGVRYEVDGIIFTTKGDYGSVTENGTATYNNCILGTDEGNTFTDGSHRFSFRHTNDMLISGGSAAYESNWKQNTTTLGQQILMGTISREAQPQTNFAGATFTFGTSTNLDAVQDCLILTNGEHLDGEIVINGVTYKKITVTDAGAGNYYDTTSYRTVRNGQCYVIEYTIHSTNIGNYDPSQGIKEFSRSAITSVLELAVQSFAFLPE